VQVLRCHSKLVLFVKYTTPSIHLKYVERQDSSNALIIVFIWVSYIND
jgi:hypothetical protein